MTPTEGRLFDLHAAACNRNGARHAVPLRLLTPTPAGPMCVARGLGRGNMPPNPRHPAHPLFSDTCGVGDGPRGDEVPALFNGAR